jgi:hypothetical protein
MHCVGQYSQQVPHFTHFSRSTTGLSARQSPVLSSMCLVAIGQRSSGMVDSSKGFLAWRFIRNPLNYFLTIRQEQI